MAALDNSNGYWRPGSFVTAAIALSERRVDVVVPTSAIQNVDGGKAIFVRNKDGFEKRNVALGEQDGQAVEISSGMAPGETIAVSNTFSLKAELAKPRDED